GWAEHSEAHRLISITKTRRSRRWAFCFVPFVYSWCLIDGLRCAQPILRSGGDMTILVESFHGYRRITLNRPERLNALTVEMAAALGAALDEAEADGDCRALLLTGAGRAFCAGQDLTAIVDAKPADLGRLLDHYHPLVLK